MEITEDNFRENLVLYEILQKHLQELHNQQQLIERRLSEIEMTEQALADMKTLNPENEIAVPIGSEFFFFTKVPEKREFFVNIGGGVVLKKDLSQADIILKKKRSDAESAKTNVEREFSETVAKLNSLGHNLQEFQKKMIENLSQNMNKK